MKTCTTCKAKKDGSEFHKRASAKDGLTPRCKACTLADCARYRASDPDRQKRRYWKDPEKYRAYSRRWHHANPGHKYGLSKEEYDALLKEHDGVCAICKRPPDGVGRNGKRLSVDHDHRTETVRGLLCRDCNSAVGLFRDRPDLLEAAARYLRS